MRGTIVCWLAVLLCSISLCAAVEIPVSIFQNAPGKAILPTNAPGGSAPARTEADLGITLLAPGQASLQWSANPQAGYYKVYRASLPLPADDPGWEYLGRTLNLSFPVSVGADREFFQIRAVLPDPGFVTVQGGTYNLSDGSGHATVSSYFISQYETTQSEYLTVMGSNPASGYGVGNDYPVYNVSWFNAIEYCNRRSLLEGLSPCYNFGSTGTDPNNWPVGWNTVDGNQVNIICDWSAERYRLPTMMEWKFAATGGNYSQGYYYSGSDDPDEVAWYSSNAGMTTHQVGTKLPNELGIYDMTGNIWEFVWDYWDVPWWGFCYCYWGDHTNSYGFDYGFYRSLQGGDINNLTSVHEMSGGVTPTGSDYYLGFRICKAIPWIPAPTLSLASGLLGSEQLVSVSCEDPAALIRYTFDGSDPSEVSQLYVSPIPITRNRELKVKAFKDGIGPSATKTGSYSLSSMISVEGGTFNNGSSNVTLSDFLLSAFELTQSEYQAVMGGYLHPGCSAMPRDGVSWFDAIEYCNRRSLAEGFQPCYSYGTFGNDPDAWPVGWDTDVNHTNVACNWTANGYRLPTEMEWMFAAKGGNLSNGYLYSGSDNLDEVGWYSDNSGYILHSTGLKISNELGFYDMSGNVREHCWDNYATYPTAPQFNPHGPTSGSSRVIRGGHCCSFNSCKVSFREHDAPDYDFEYIGFRVCRSRDDLVMVPGGTFNNGTSNVTISTFHMDPYELTQEKYQAVMGSNPSHFSGVNLPVERTTWYNAIEYCNRRSILEGFTPCYSYLSYGTDPNNWPAGWNTADANHVNVSFSRSANGYRLPTEMEWQFAARGGIYTHNYTYSGSNTIGAVAWYDGNAGGTTHPVGLKTPNELGIYDMSGNVWEWNWDRYAAYPTGPQTDPVGPNTGNNRSERGGSWNLPASPYCTVSSRNGGNPTYTTNILGIRLARGAIPAP